jgi:hypothetical protein
MELYTCKVRLGGSMLHEVVAHSMFPTDDGDVPFKNVDQVTAADIIMLRHLHGEDSVLNIKHVGSIKRTDAEQRDLLRQTYGTGEFDSSLSGQMLVQQVFGPAGVKLPQELEGVEHMNKHRPRVVKDPNAVRAEDNTEAKESADALID